MNISFEAKQLLLLEKVASGHSVDDVLAEIVDLVDGQSEQILCTLFTLDANGGRLERGFSKRIPMEYITSLEGCPIGPDAGSCGAAAFHRIEVVVEEIATHPNWRPYRDYALTFGLKACWSTPILSTTSETLGTFAIYYKEPKRPEDEEREWVSRATHLATIAIEKERAQQALHKSRARAQQQARLYAVSSRTNAAMLQLSMPLEICQAACRIPVEGKLATLAWMGCLDNESESVRILAKHGLDQGHLSTAEFPLDDPRMLGEAVSCVLDHGMPFVVNGIQNNVETYWKKDAEARGFRAVAAFPVEVSKQERGVLVLYGDSPNCFKEEEVRVLSSLAENVSRSLEGARWKRERSKLLSALGERVKELTTLHQLSRILQSKAEDSILPKIVQLLPGGFRYPDRTVTRISWGLAVAESVGWKKDKWTLRASFQAGVIEVSILESSETADPFLDEERELLSSIAEMLERASLRRAAETKLRARESLLRIAERVARIGGWSMAAPDFEPVWSEGLYRLHQVSAEYKPSLERNLEFFSTDYREKLRQATRECIEYGVPFDLEAELITHRKENRWVRVIGLAERDDQGVVVRIQGALQDISERRKLEEQLRQTQKLEAVGQLAGGVAHDFNNLLTVILSYSSLALDTLNPDEPLYTDIQEIADAGEKASQLTRQLLAFSRKQILEPRVINLNECAVGLKKMLKNLVGENIRIEWQLEEGLKQILADPVQIEQVLMNLVVNARDAMKEGGSIDISTSNVGEIPDELFHDSVQDSGGYVQLTVADNGSGIPPEVKSKIFDPFFTTKFTGKGTGLGLATVWGIVRQSGGYISVESEMDVGTTFQLYFPSVDDSCEIIAPATAEPGSLNGTETVLLVEDDSQVRSVTHNILKNHGYKVMEAQNAGEALLLCEKTAETIHLLLTDVVMPVMNGRELAERISSIREGMKVLYVSGYPESVLGDNGILASGVSFLAKPLTPETLLPKIKEILESEEAC